MGTMFFPSHIPLPSDPVFSSPSSLQLLHLIYDTTLYLSSILSFSFRARGERALILYTIEAVRDMSFEILRTEKDMATHKKYVLMKFWRHLYFTVDLILYVTLRFIFTFSNIVCFSESHVLLHFMFRSSLTAFHLTDLVDVRSVIRKS